MSNNALKEYESLKENKLDHYSVNIVSLLFPIIDHLIKENYRLEEIVEELESKMTK